MGGAIEFLALLCQPVQHEFHALGSGQELEGRTGDRELGGTLVPDLCGPQPSAAQENGAGPPGAKDVIDVGQQVGVFFHGNAGRLIHGRLHAGVFAEVGLPQEHQQAATTHHFFNLGEQDVEQ